MLIPYLKKSVLLRLEKAKYLPLLLVIVFSACGYSFQGSGSILPEDVKKIYIPRAENYTTEPGLSDLVTEAMRERFERFGVVQVTEEIAGADAIMKTKIMSLKRGTNTVTSNTSTALQLDSILSLSSELRRISGGLLWKNDNIKVQKSFAGAGNVVVASAPGFASGGLSQGDINALDDRELARGQEQQVLEVLVEQAARQVYNEAVAPEF